MPALRVMTFNVQMLPLAAMVVLGSSDDAVERADRVVDAILSLPADEQPDVIAFNEVFHEDARDRLIDRLTGYPNRIEKVDNTFDLEDAGIMLFSKYGFLQLPCGDNFYTRIYDDSAGDDSHAAKAVCIVQINYPTDNVTLAFTHLQASYVNDTEHSDVRSRQIDSVFGAIGTALQEYDARNWRNIIFMGDLNIRGDLAAGTTEWRDVFELGTLGSTFVDGWREWMHAPREAGADPGLTNIDFEQSIMRRLDYQCFIRSTSSEIVAHHMQVRLRDQSDHFALESYVCRRFPHCTPSDAVLLSDVPYLGAGSPAKAIRLRFEDLDGYQWVYVDKPGTYTIHTSVTLTLSLYLDDDYSHAIQSADTLDINHVPAGLGSYIERHRLGREGKTFAMRRPFFVAVRNRANGPPVAELTIFRHTGDTPERAIWLPPHTDVGAGFPQSQPLGTTDLCWFRAFLPKTFASVGRAETFVVRKPGNFWSELVILDDAQQSLDSVSGTGSQIELDYSTQGGEYVYLSLARENYDQDEFSIRLRTPVNYIAFDQPSGFYIKEESGIGILGADEISLTVTVDGQSLFTGYWDDADTGERWPGFSEAMKVRLQSSMPGAIRLPFVYDITLAYREDDFTASGSMVEIVPPLQPGEPDLVPRIISLPMPDAFDDAEYRFYCTLSRYPD